MPNDVDDLGERLRRGREVLGWSRSDAADAIGVSASQILRYEKNDSTVPLYVAVRFADALGISLDALIGRATPGPMVAFMCDTQTVLITPERQVFQYTGDLPFNVPQAATGPLVPDLRSAAQAAIEAARQLRHGDRRRGPFRNPEGPPAEPE